jgi:hypothetical protein
MMDLNPQSSLISVGLPPLELGENGGVPRDGKRTIDDTSI